MAGGIMKWVRGSEKIIKIKKKYILDKVTRMWNYEYSKTV
jgi:hypothetical protein